MFAARNNQYQNSLNVSDFLKSLHKEAKKKMAKKANYSSSQLQPLAAENPLAALSNGLHRSSPDSSTHFSQHRQSASLGGIEDPYSSGALP
jgi:hypothetical protein